jgi:hypothetical protein
MKNIHFLLLIMIFVIISCNQGIEVGLPPYFGISNIYPNIVNSDDTITIGLHFYELTLKSSKLNDFRVNVKNSTIDTLKIIGLYDNTKLDTNKITGIFNTDDDSVKVVMKSSQMILQCVVNDLRAGEWKIEIVNNKHKTSNDVYFVKY